MQAHHVGDHEATFVLGDHPQPEEALEHLVGAVDDWTDLDSHLLRYIADPAMRATVRASAFSATLELVREGKLQLRQEAAFAPLLVRPVRAGTEAVQ